MLEAEVYPATTQKRVSRQAICAVFGESYDPVAWQDWRWQMRHRLHRQDQFERLLALSHEERVGLSLPSQRFAVAVTPPFSALMDHDDPHCPIRKRVIPREEELVAGPGDLLDPCGEDQHMVVEGLVHRYPGRVLLLAQAAGAAYCRSCTRWRLVAQGDLNALPRRLEAILGYLHAHPEVRDVLISGGHPLLFSDDRLDALLSATRSVPSVELVRVGSRVPGFLPQRITPQLAAVLRKYRVGLSLHFSHPRELTPEVATACDTLADAGIPLGSETVWRKGINDDAATLRKLFTGLLKLRVRPYDRCRCDAVGYIAFAHIHCQGIGNHAPAPRFHQRVRGSHVRGRCPGWGWKNPVAAGNRGGLRGGNVAFAQLGRHALHLPRPVPRMKALRLGFVGDCQEEYLAQGFTPAHVAEFDPRATVKAITAGLPACGHEVSVVSNGLALAQALAGGQRFDLVFNIAEGLAGFSREAQVPALGKLYRQKYTFSDPLTCALTLHKAMAKRVVRDAGLPTAPFFLVENPENLQHIPFPGPYFAKPVAEKSSKGISARCQAKDTHELSLVCKELRELFQQPVLVEAFLPGREVTVGIVGNGPEARVLGVMEVAFTERAETQAYTALNKQEYQERVRYRLLKDEPLGHQAGEVALAAYHHLGCRDAARIDLRCDASGKPQFLEANPLPGLDPVRSDLPILARLAGMEYVALLSAIVEAAWRRP